MKIKMLSAGDIIDSRCTRCRDILNHRIVAMVGDKVARVECNTCGSVHNYYPPPAPKSIKTRKKDIDSKKTRDVSRSSRRANVDTDREEWLTLRSAMNPDQAIRYDMNKKFSVNDLVLHSVFGLGMVKSVTNPNKMLVLFEDGVKLLRCG